MKVNLREVRGPWKAGWVLDKHVVASTYVGDDDYGHPRFNTQRTEAGEATYKLKYREDWTQIAPLAQALAKHIYPKLDNIGFILPMPASKPRIRQPVAEVALELGRLVAKPVFVELLLKRENCKPLKDINTKAEKLDAISDSLHVADTITNQGQWNVLLIDDLFDTGASMEAACKVLHAYEKVSSIYVAALTWK